MENLIRTLQFIFGMALVVVAIWLPYYYRKELEPVWRLDPMHWMIRKLKEWFKV